MTAFEPCRAVSDQTLNASYRWIVVRVKRLCSVIRILTVCARKSYYIFAEEHLFEPRRTETLNGRFVNEPGTHAVRPLALAYVNWVTWHPRRRRLTPHPKRQLPMLSCWLGWAEHWRLLCLLISVSWSASMLSPTMLEKKNNSPCRIWRSQFTLLSSNAVAGPCFHSGAMFVTIVEPNGHEFLYNSH